MSASRFVQTKNNSSNNYTSFDSSLREQITEEGREQAQPQTRSAQNAQSREEEKKAKKCNLEVTGQDTPLIRNTGIDAKLSYCYPSKEPAPTLQSTDGNPMSAAEKRELMIAECKKQSDVQACYRENSLSVPQTSGTETTDQYPANINESNDTYLSSARTSNRNVPSNKTCQLFASDTQIANSFSKYNLSEAQIGYLKAFLITVRFAEGTEGSDGYYKKVGGEVQEDPFSTGKVKLMLRGKVLLSSAAGAYQIMGYSKKTIEKGGFEVNVNPDVQDLAALKLLEIQAGSKTFMNIANGNWKSNLTALNSIWAGIPRSENDSGGRYNQHTKRLSFLNSIFIANSSDARDK